jgi:Type VI secretion system (T6SS), amidase effector protein 4
MAKPDFDLMWRNFPDHSKYPNLETLHKFIGGQLANNINVPGFGPNGNTCAVRMSRALNYGALPISAKLIASLGLHTIKGADSKPYLFRVRELKTYLRNAIGVRPTSATKNFDTAFSGTRGIVAFDVTGWSDASGHVALWDGSAFVETHDDYRGLKDDPATPQKEARTVKMTLWAL